MNHHTPLLCALALALCGPARASSPTSPEGEALTRIVRALGAANGKALACGERELAQRARDIMVARVPKSRAHGETFEAATQAAFLAQGNEKTACPARLALTLEIESAAKPLAPPSAHRLAEPPEALESGLNPRYLLQAANGRAIMDGDFRHQFQLITFGYTHCPDVCPTTLSEIASVLKQLGDDAGRVQALFFSLDPERDTLAHLRSYTAFFDARILGATGKPELLQHAAKNFKVRFEKVAQPGADPAHYAIDHTTGMFLLAPGGQFIARFAYGASPESIAQRLREEIALRPPAAARSSQ